MQSGCDTTLRRMNRHYTSGEYFEKCQMLRKYFAYPAITTDVIVGFPGETDEEFETTRAFIEKVGFYETHVFKYSRRNGTKAAQMPHQVPDQEKAKRSQILLDLCQRKKKEFEDGMIGRKVEVLLEETVEREGILYRTGFTKEYVKVEVTAGWYTGKSDRRTHHGEVSNGSASKFASDLIVFRSVWLNNG